MSLFLCWIPWIILVWIIAVWIIAWININCSICSICIILLVVFFLNLSIVPKFPPLLRFGFFARELGFSSWFSWFSRRLFRWELWWGWFSKELMLALFYKLEVVHLMKSRLYVLVLPNFNGSNESEHSSESEKFHLKIC